MKNKKMHLLCYDTLLIAYKFNDTEESLQYIDLIEKVLDESEVEANKITGQLELTGNIFGMYVNVNAVEVIISGSLCKSYFGGSNLFSMTLDEIEQHLKKLADSLKLPLLEADVRRIDIGTSLLVQNQPENYFNALGDTSMCKRLRCPNSLYYINSYKKLIFYDKIKEMKKKRNSGLVTHQYKNVLRYELAWRKDIANKFNRDKILVKDLYDKDFFTVLINRWVDEYEEINKHRLFKPSIDKLTSGQAVDYTLSALISLHGQENLYMITDTLKDNFKAGAKSRYREHLRKLKFLAIESELITELNAKILEAKNNTLTLSNSKTLEEAIY